MASDTVNRCTFIGRLGRDVEIVGEGKSRRAVFSLATESGYKDKETEEWKTTTDWIRVVTWLPWKIEYLEKHGKKGAGIYVEARAKTRSEEIDGKKYQLTDFVVEQDGAVIITNYAEAGGE